MQTTAASCLKIAARRGLCVSPIHIGTRRYSVRSLSNSFQKSNSNGPDFKTPKSDETKLTQGDIYYHNELGYRGVIMYDFLSTSTFYDSEHEVDQQLENMYLGMLLSDPLETTRTKVEKHLTTIMVDNDGSRNTISNVTPGVEENIVKAPLPGLDVISEKDIVQIMEPNMEFDLENARVPYLNLFFEANNQKLVPREKIIAKWKDSYDIETNSYCLRHKFEDEQLTAEFFLYPYDPFTRCNDRTNHKNNCFRYRVNVSTDGLMNKPDQSLVVGPLFWRFKGQIEQNDVEESDSSIDKPANISQFVSRTMYHDPVQLTHRRKSAQFSSDIFVNKKWHKIELTPMLVCKQLGPIDLENDNKKNLNNAINPNSTDQTRTFQFPAFEIVQNNTE
jgi:hypothetical protein